MRIMGFTKHWKKLDADRFTTFRYARKDEDWKVDEKVQIVLRPRSEDRKWLGVAQIINKEDRNVSWIKRIGVKSLTLPEAIKDGFKTRSEMIAWLYNLYGDRILEESMHLLLLHWIEKPNDL